MMRMQQTLFAALLVVGAAALLLTPPAAADICHLDDVIVDGSLCVGFDCVCGESFGFDTIRLKENNLRIHFDDTSTAGSYPRNDWRIIINDSTNGGASYFSVEDSTAGRRPFTIRAGAPANSLYVDSGGRLGLGTSTPALEAHIKDGDTPSLRLEQDGSSGFTPQTWDVAGNETNFFIRDVTHGSALPFRIRPDAPGNSIFVDTDGDVGLGTSSPADKLHLSGGNLRVTRTETANTVLARLENDGPISFDYVNNGSGVTWRLNNLAGGFAISVAGSGVNEFFITNAGNVEVPQGTVVHTSSRTIKQDIEPVNSRRVLERVAALPVATWRYDRGLQEEALHLGPMAEDFYAAFGLGDNEKTLSSADVSGVALAAIQGLVQEIESRDAEISRLEARLAALEDLVGSLQP